MRQSGARLVRFSEFENHLVSNAQPAANGPVDAGIQGRSEVLAKISCSHPDPRQGTTELVADNTRDQRHSPVAGAREKVPRVPLASVVIVVRLVHRREPPFSRPDDAVEGHPQLMHS